MRKLKLFTDNYTKKYEDLDRNLGNIGKNINIIEFEYNNVSNRLKNISIKRFVEHIVEDDLKQDELPTKIKETPIIFSKEERERNILTDEQKELQYYKKKFRPNCGICICKFLC